jgi:aminoglycoside 3-N-acetyltransferase
VELANQAYDVGQTHCVRSRHPSHSIVAFGNRARDYIRWDEDRFTPCPWDGCTGRLYAEGGKILLVGVDHSVNSFFHAVDEFLALPNRMRPNARCFTTRDSDGSCTQGMYYVHTGPFSEYYENYAPYLLHTGAVTEGKLGDARVRLCDAVKCTHDLQRLWAQAEFDLCQARREIPFPK